MPEQIQNQEAIDESEGNIGDILSRLLQNQSAPKSEQTSPDLLSSLLSNPELISKLPQLISLISPLIGGFLGGSPKETSKPSEQTTLPAISQKPSHSSNGDSRSALLCAIKPYLCADRQAAVDYIIKLSRLGEILKTL